MIVHMLSNKVLEPIITELFISGTKINLSIVFITQSHFAVSKNVMLKHRKREESLLFHGNMLKINLPHRYLAQIFKNIQNSVLCGRKEYYESFHKILEDLKNEESVEMLSEEICNNKSIHSLFIYFY